MLVTYHAATDVLELHWSTEPSQPAEWRKARANIDLLVSQANETLGVSISAASWLCPELANVHADLEATLTLASWISYRQPPVPTTRARALRGLGRANAQPALSIEPDYMRPAGAKGKRGICRYCGAVAANRKNPGAEGWWFQDVCSECTPTSPEPAEMIVRPDAQRVTETEPRRPKPCRTPNPHSGPRGRNSTPSSYQPENSSTPETQHSAKAAGSWSQASATTAPGSWENTTKCAKPTPHSSGQEQPSCPQTCINDKSSQYNNLQTESFYRP